MKNLLFILFILISITAFGQSSDNHPKVFNVKNYGAKGDGVTDDTRAIQACINACYLSRYLIGGGGGVVFFPNGVYIIGDTLSTNPTFSGSIRYGGSNSQLWVPVNQTPFQTRPIISIELVGEQTPNMFFSRLVSYPINRSGVVLYSTIDGSGTYPAIFGTAGDAWTYGNLNDAMISIKNINFRVKANIASTGPTMSAANLRKFSNIGYLENILCDIDTALYHAVYPSALTFGLFLPYANNSAFNPINNIAVGGYKYGYIFSEHTTGNNLVAAVNEYGYMITGAPHAQHFGRIGSYWNKYSIAASSPDFGASASYLDVRQIDIETDSAVSWTTNRYHIYDSTNVLRGDITYHNVVRGVGVSEATFNKLGGTNANLQIRYIGQYPDTTSGTGFATRWFRKTAIDTVLSLIPAQVNLIEGTDIDITGSYPNLTINSTAASGAGNWSTVGGSVYRPSNTRVGIGQAVPTSRLEVTTDGLGATAPDSMGIVLSNNTAAAAGAQQYSPPVTWVGKGWKTTATAASQDVRFRAYVVPVQGAANPTANLLFDASINGGAFGTPLTLNSNGNLVAQTQTTNGAHTFGGTITQNNGGAVSFTGVITSAESGLTTTPTDFLIFSNSTNATSGVPVQNPGMINFTGKAWDGSATRTSNLRFGMQQTSGASPITTNYVWSAQINAGGYTDIMKLHNSGRLALTAPVTLKGYTVATLPAGNTGDVAYVTDATAPTYLGALTGGGSVVCPVFYNGTAWVSH